MHVAAFYGNLEILAELIKRGADINVVTNNKQNGLHLAARSEKPNKEFSKIFIRE